jgi:hypothetical protein
MKATLRIFLPFLLLSGLFLTQCSKRTETLCSTCGTCSDGIKDRDETGIDCGGQCGVCATCYDGIKNQDETDVDCGGTCAVCQIIYPANGNFGFNILNYDTLMPLKGTPRGAQPSAFFSFRAEIPESFSLKIKITNLSPVGNMWEIVNNTVSGWTIVNPANNAQEFTAPSKGNYDLKLYFNGTNGQALIEFYETAATTPTRVKRINWIQ